MKSPVLEAIEYLVVLRTASPLYGVVVTLQLVGETTAHSGDISNRSSVSVLPVGYVVDIVYRVLQCQTLYPNYGII